MNKRVTTITRSNGAQRRFAWAQPRVLATLMVLTLASAVWWATAQTAKSPAFAPMAASNNATPNTGKKKPLSLRDLPALMRSYGEARRAQMASQRAGVSSQAAGLKTAGAMTAGAITANRFSLTETDLTPGNLSDEREPQYRPSGDFIAFISNGADAVNNVTGTGVPDGKIDKTTVQAKYHVWIMRRDGTGQRQVTGFGVDSGRDQRSPSWSPDGNRLVYTDGDAASNQLFIVSPFGQDPSTRKPPIQQLTFFAPAGKLRDPAWGSSGAIAFSSTVVPGQNNSTVPTSGSRYDIFAIDPSGSTLTLRRLTGGPTDVLGDETDDWASSFSLINVNVLFFSSNRAFSATSRQFVRVNGRRIFAMSALDGSRKRQISDPLVADPPTVPSGLATDFDDNPAPSLQLNTAGGTRNERLAFERTRRIDTSDQTRDLNIWSLIINSTQLAPPPTVPASALTVVGSTSNNIRDYSLVNGAFRRDVASQLLNNPQDLVYGPDQTGDGYPELYVTNADRAVGVSNGTIEAYDGISGQLVRTASSAAFSNPSGIAVGPDNATIYVASRTSGEIFRFTPPFTFLTRFSIGNVGGIEGIAFGNDLDNDGVSELYAAALAPNRITVYSGASGLFIRDFVIPNEGGLVTPVDLTFGRDANGDGVSDLYVLDRGTGSVKIFNGSRILPASGTFISNLVPANSLNFPSRLIFGNDANRDGAADLFVSDNSFFFGQGTVNRYDGRTGAPLPATGQTGAVFISDTRLTGATGLALNPVASGAFRPGPASTIPIETSTNPAQLESNALSSPAALSAANFTGATEDKSADREPSFARSSATNQIVSQIVFASQRMVAAAPSKDPANPKPVVKNPGGGPQYNNPVPSTAITPLTRFTHDIWTTGVEDTTPPVVVPQAVGGQLYPALAPGIQAPFTAPRTAEEGLSPGKKVTIAFVVQDLESGLKSARVEFKDADRPTFQTQDSIVDAIIGVEIAVEQQPEIASSTNSSTGLPLRLRIFDNGPVSAGGNERQFGAIKGDGNYYCEGSFATVSDAGTALNGDFYIDLFVTDNADNSFAFDNVYGFSTRTFAKNNKVLFVSDYTVGQVFPSLINGFSPRSTIQTDPIESYYLNNPGGSTGAITPEDLAVPARPIPDTTSLGSFQVDPVSGQTDYVDVWRILCRGPIPFDRLLLYSPQITEQLIPGLDPDGDGIPGPYRQEDGTLFPDVTRQTAVASSCVVWASPYTGAVFAGPGTLYDSKTQEELTDYLETGGRLFVSGQEVAFALSNSGTVNNNFLANELKATYTGESGANTLNGSADTLIVNGNAVGEGPNPEPPVTLNIPPGIPNASYQDAASNQQGMDVIAPTAAAAGETITPLYNYAGGGLAAQRIEKVRAGGLESRLVFFGFGYEAVHRKYRNPASGLPTRCVNFRAKIFYNMTRIYFYTGGISGRVISRATNEPIPGFLIEVLGNNGQNFIAETDSNGEYEILGMPFGGYTVRPLQYDDNGTIRSANGSFLPGPGSGAFVTGGDISRDINFIVQPSPPGSISGRAISDKGTVDVSNDAIPSIQPAVNLPVLIRSIKSLKASASFPQGGIYAALTVTDGAGRFAFRNVPSNETYELIFNPLPGFTDDVNLQTRGDIPPNSGIVYPNPNPAASPQVNLSYERRVIPVDPAYGLDFTSPALRTVADDNQVMRPGFIVDIGQDLNLGDVPIRPGNGPDPGTGGGTNDDFQVGSVYMISIPYMDSSALTATTTPERAFTLPIVDTKGTVSTADDIVNYRLTRFDALTQTYIALGNGALLKRGEGYFMRPVSNPVSFKRPPTANPVRVPLPSSVNQFTVTLRRSASLAPTASNGFNLIGFPFHPDTFKSVNWSVSRVYVPAHDGQPAANYSTLTAAVAAGALAGNLQTLANATGNTYVDTTKMVPFKGYYAKTFVDNVQVTLIASTTP